MAEKSSKALFEEAQRYIPGGVNSPVRAFRAVGKTPLFIERALGSKIYDIEGKEYIDYVCSWGPLILGHAHPRIVNAVQQVAAKGTSYGAPTELEVELAKLIVQAVPSIEMVRLVNSGTEAAMSAIRVARGYTGRDKILKFEGCYHGHADALLVKAGSGATTLGIPDSLGVPSDLAKLTITLPYNDLEKVQELFRAEGEQIACVIVEPVAGNMGVILPRPGFLEGLREVTTRYESLLIFDEVITGFRVAYGGAQELFGIRPDLTCLGKIIGGGLPVGAYGGRKEIMEKVAPLGGVYQAGTLSGNPLATSAGIAMLKILAEKKVYQELDEKSKILNDGIEQAAREVGVPIYQTRLGSMFCAFFTEKEVIDYTSAKSSDTERYARFFHAMLDGGVNLAPSQFEAGFLSTAHSQGDIQTTIDVAREAFRQVID
ncbi:MAG: glutamate-1-semialdehyde 2,1-aminomutase [Candidatus Tectomicrobia bacterium]|nr:glutamate-1-semialdehyde 2,1-aminomutase [Candidatus Tectomicrobia bacterium]